MGWSSGTSKIYAVVVMPLSPLGPTQSLTEAIIRGLTIMGIALLVALRLGTAGIRDDAAGRALRVAFPVTLDRDAWYFGSSTIVLMLLGVLAAYGCSVAVGSQRRVLRQVATSPPTMAS